MAYTSFYTPPHLIAPAQVLEGALFHYFCGTEGDLRLAHLLVDNAIELLTLAYLCNRDPENFEAKQGQHKAYVGRICKELGINERTTKTLLECHKQRNNFYHQNIAGSPARTAVYRYIRECLTFTERILGTGNDEFEMHTLRLGFLIAIFRLESTLRERGQQINPHIRFNTIQDLPNHEHIDQLLPGEDELYPITVDQLMTVIECLNDVFSTNQMDEVELENSRAEAIRIRTSLEGISYK